MTPARSTRVDSAANTITIHQKVLQREQAARNCRTQPYHSDQSRMQGALLSEDTDSIIVLSVSRGIILAPDEQTCSGA